MLDHPCPFPEEIPWRLIQLYSYPGDVVLDPFLGSGQTTKVAKQLGRRWVGYDVVAEYIDYAAERLEEPLGVRELQLIADFNKIELDADRAGSGRPGTNTRHGSGRKSES
jgi:site-specific DNA-methyltransferase (adenine-specific)